MPDGGWQAVEAVGDVLVGGGGNRGAELSHAVTERTLRWPLERPRQRACSEKRHSLAWRLGVAKRIGRAPESALRAKIGLRVRFILSYSCAHSI